MSPSVQRGVVARAAALGLVLGLASSVQAQSLEQRTAQLSASACYACHGPEGRSEGGMPSLHGQPEEALLTALLEFRRGLRAPTVMHQIARGYTEDELRAMARALAAAPAEDSAAGAGSAGQ